MSDQSLSKQILVVVTGGIAVYKAAFVVRELVKSGMETRVIMTAAATEFVQPLTFETLSRNHVGIDMFGDRRSSDPLSHISFGSWCSHVLVCPATANFIAKMANGIADDLASATVLATRSPKIVCPAMNSGMWANPATTRNIRALQDWGVTIIGPAEGELACNTSGAGRMVEPDLIVRHLAEL